MLSTMTTITITTATQTCNPASRSRSITATTVTYQSSIHHNEQELSIVNQMRLKPLDSSLLPARRFSNKKNVKYLQSTSKMHKKRSKYYRNKQIIVFMLVLVAFCFNFYPVLMFPCCHLLQ